MINTISQVLFFCRMDCSNPSNVVKDPLLFSIQYWQMKPVMQFMIRTATQAWSACQRCSQISAVHRESMQSQLSSSRAEGIQWSTVLPTLVTPRITKSIPNDWRCGVTLTFWKGKGDKHLCSKHCSITLLSITGIRLLARVRPVLQSKCCPERAGLLFFFLEGVPLDRYLLFVSWSKTSKEFNRCADISCIDFKAAFDSVCLGEYLESLSKVRGPVPFLRPFYTS